MRNCAGLAVDHHQPRGVAGLERGLGDEFWGQIIIKLMNVHGLNLLNLNPLGNRFADTAGFIDTDQA